MTSRPGPRYAALALLAVLAAGCTHATRPAPPAPTSALSGGAVTCTRTAGGCASSGHLRWSVPLAGTYRVNVGGSALTILGMLPVSISERGSLPYLITDGERVYLAAGDRLLAVTAATGRVAWTRRFAGTEADELTLLGGRLLTGQRTLAGGYQFRSVDPRTGRGRTIAARTDESRVGDRNSPVSSPPGGLVLLRGGYGLDTPPGVRWVDPVTGASRWETRLRAYRGYDVRDGVLYLDDYVQGTGPRAVQRVDLDTGRRLPDIRLPKALHGDSYLDRVTASGVVVFAPSGPGDTGRTFAVDRHGRRVTPVPQDRDRTSTTPDQVRVQGRADAVQHLVATDRSGKRRWTGPAMRGYLSNGVGVLDTHPRLVVTTGCAPDGLHQAGPTEPLAGLFCRQPRLFAVTW